MRSTFYRYATFNEKSSYQVTMVPLNELHDDVPPEVENRVGEALAVLRPHALRVLARDELGNLFLEIIISLVSSSIYIRICGNNPNKC